MKVKDQWKACLIAGLSKHVLKRIKQRRVSKTEVIPPGGYRKQNLTKELFKLAHQEKAFSGIEQILSELWHWEKVMFIFPKTV